MTDWTYVFYGHGRSWHVAKFHTRAINGWKTLCGRYIETTDTMDELPAAKSCEVCLRLATRQVEVVPA